MTLQDLYRDKKLLKEVKEYFTQFLIKVGTEKMFKGESVVGMDLAKKALDEGFENLELMYAPKRKKEKVIPNEAR